MTGAKNQRPTIERRPNDPRYLASFIWSSGGFVPGSRGIGSFHVKSCRHFLRIINLGLEPLSSDG